MSGYPIDTKCVVTWARPPSYFKVGDIVIVLSDAFVWKSNTSIILNERLFDLVNSPFFDGMLMHMVKFESHGAYAWPVDWMRPIDKDMSQEDEGFYNKVVDRRALTA